VCGDRPVLTGIERATGGAWTEVTDAVQGWFGSPSAFTPVRTGGTEHGPDASRAPRQGASRWRARAGAARIERTWDVVNHDVRKKYGHVRRSCCGWAFFRKRCQPVGSGGGGPPRFGAYSIVFGRPNAAAGTAPPGGRLRRAGALPLVEGHSKGRRAVRSCVDQARRRARAGGLVGFASGSSPKDGPATPWAARGGGRLSTIHHQRYWFTWPSPSDALGARERRGFVPLRGLNHLRWGPAVARLRQPLRPPTRPPATRRRMTAERARGVLGPGVFWGGGGGGGGWGGGGWGGGRAGPRTGS